MSWTLHRWTWQIMSPLFVGDCPAEALNRCRLYVPARALWGAVTAEVARAKITGFPEYPNQGERVYDNLRFSYLYPAEQIGNRYMSWLPEYTKGRGLVWRREDNRDLKDALEDRIFRRRLLNTRAGTAIEPSSDSAHEGSLRETECVQPYWRKDNAMSFEPVHLVGYVFAKDDELWKEVEDACKALSVGGDTRYGLGRILRIKTEASYKLFDCRVELANGNPMVKAKRILGHAHDSNGKSELSGAREILLGWDRQNKKDKNKSSALKNIGDDAPLWVPGSISSYYNKETSALEQEIPWELDKKGIWKRCED